MYLIKDKYCLLFYVSFNVALLFYTTRNSFNFAIKIDKNNKQIVSLFSCVFLSKYKNILDVTLP